MASFKLCPHTCHTDHNRSWRLKSCPIYPGDEFDAHLRTHNTRCNCEVSSEESTISDENWTVWGKSLGAWYTRQGRNDIVESMAPQYCNSLEDLAFIQRLANWKHLNKGTAIARSKSRSLVTKVMKGQVAGDIFCDVREETAEEEQAEAVTARGSETRREWPDSRRHGLQGTESPRRCVQDPPHPPQSILALQMGETEAECSAIFRAGELEIGEDTVQTHARTQSPMLDDRTGQGEDRSLSPRHILERYHEMMSNEVSFRDLNLVVLLEDFNKAAELCGGAAGEMSGGAHFNIDEWMDFNVTGNIEAGNDHTNVRQVSPSDFLYITTPLCAR